MPRNQVESPSSRITLKKAELSRRGFLRGTLSAVAAALVGCLPSNRETPTPKTAVLPEAATAVTPPAGNGGTQTERPVTITATPEVNQELIKTLDLLKNQVESDLKKLHDISVVIEAAAKEARERDQRESLTLDQIDFISKKISGKMAEVHKLEESITKNLTAMDELCKQSNLTLDDYLSFITAQSETFETELSKISSWAEEVESLTILLWMEAGYIDFEGKDLKDIQEILDKIQDITKKIQGHAGESEEYVFVNEEFQRMFLNKKEARYSEAVEHFLRDNEDYEARVKGFDLKTSALIFEIQLKDENGQLIPNAIYEAWWLGGNAAHGEDFMNNSQLMIASILDISLTGDSDQNEESTRFVALTEYGSLTRIGHVATQPPATKFMHEWQERIFGTEEKKEKFLQFLQRTADAIVGFMKKDERYASRIRNDHPNIRKILKNNNYLLMYLAENFTVQRSSIQGESMGNGLGIVAIAGERTDALQAYQMYDGSESVYFRMSSIVPASNSVTFYGSFKKMFISTVKAAVLEEPIDNVYAETWQKPRSVGAEEWDELNGAIELMFYYEIIEPANQQARAEGEWAQSSLATAVELPR